MGLVVEKFNKLQRAFGALKILRIDHVGVMFELSTRRYFLGHIGLFEVCEAQDRVGTTAHSEWLDAIACGKVRDEEGNMVWQTTS